MTARELRLLLLLCLVAVLCAAAQSIAGVHTSLLFLSPALVIALPLLAGRYVGEERLLAIARALPRPRRRARRSRPACGLPAQVLPRGGLLIATALAVRPPPAATFTH
jgi:hypothetical protein